MSERLFIIIYYNAIWFAKIIPIPILKIIIIIPTFSYFLNIFQPHIKITKLISSAVSKITINHRPPFSIQPIPNQLCVNLYFNLAAVFRFQISDLRLLNNFQNRTLTDVLARNLKDFHLHCQHRPETGRKLASWKTRICSVPAEFSFEKNAAASFLF